MPLSPATRAKSKAEAKRKADKWVTALKLQAKAAWKKSGGPEDDFEEAWPRIYQELLREETRQKMDDPRIYRPSL